MDIMVKYILVEECFQINRFKCEMSRCSGSSRAMRISLGSLPSSNMLGYTCE